MKWSNTWKSKCLFVFCLQLFIDLKELMDKADRDSTITDKPVTETSDTFQPPERDIPRTSNGGLTMPTQEETNSMVAEAEAGLEALIGAS